MHVGAHLHNAAEADWRHDFAEDVGGLVLVCDAADGDAGDRLEEMRATFALMEGGVAGLLRQSRRRGYGELTGAASVAADG